MPDRPILFSAPMVRALLEGRKTQTRRVLKPQPDGDVIHYGWSKDDGARWSDQSFTSHRLPYWAGDRLWVRETAATWEGEHRDVVYRADVSDREWSDLLHDARCGTAWKVRNGIFCPRAASRLTLTVTDVRVQRVQEISETDARAEGCPGQSDEELAGMEARGWFRDLWNSLNAKRGYGWDENPWVAAYTFTVERRNIDAVEMSDA